MNGNFPPNTDPNIFALTGAIVGAILTGEFNSYELNAIGNWLELVGQYLLTSAAQMQLITNRSQNNNLNQNTINKQTYQKDLENLTKAINSIHEELKNIKKEI